jgi:hypothetical protein
MELLTPSAGLFIYSLLSAIIWLSGIIFVIRVIWPRKDFSQNTKVIWSIFIIIFPPLAFIGYFAFGRKHQRAA